MSRTEEQKTLWALRVFGKLAGTCDVVKKGAKILVDGRLEISEYTDKGGQKRIAMGSTFHPAPSKGAQSSCGGDQSEKQL